eukprot:7661595-Alexandrium_andersonii.AAC.1
MSASLVGSEMCIRDSSQAVVHIGECTVCGHACVGVPDAGSKPSVCATPGGLQRTLAQRHEQCCRPC